MKGDVIGMIFDFYSDEQVWRGAEVEKFVHGLLLNKYLSYDLLVPEEVFKVGDLQVGREEHDDDGDDTEDDNAVLYLLVLRLQPVLSDPQSVHFGPYRLQRVFNHLCLQLDPGEMLLRHDVTIVGRLCAGCQRKEILLLLLVIHILDAHLVISTVEGREMMPHFLLVAHGFDFLAPRVCNS